MKTIYGYDQVRPYRPCYRIYASLAEARRRIYQHSKPAIGMVEKVNGKWHAQLFTDPLITGTGRTRDQAVNDCYAQVGGRG